MYPLHYDHEDGDHIPFMDDVDSINMSYMVTVDILALDLPSIFESAMSYKHCLGALHGQKHRLLTFESMAFSGMTYDADHCPVMVAMNRLFVQYHPAMTECVAPIVCMLSDPLFISLFV